jgi:hypothetical protein
MVCAVIEHLIIIWCCSIICPFCRIDQVAPVIVGNIAVDIIFVSKILSVLREEIVAVSLSEYDMVYFARIVKYVIINYIMNNIGGDISEIFIFLHTICIGVLRHEGIAELLAVLRALPSYDLYRGAFLVSVIFSHSLRQLIGCFPVIFTEDHVALALCPVHRKVRIDLCHRYLFIYSFELRCHSGAVQQLPFLALNKFKH